MTQVIASASGNSAAPSGTAASEANAAPRQPSFQPNEIAAFQSADKKAAMAILAIIGSILTLALVAYTFICFWVKNYPNF